MRGFRLTKYNQLDRLTGIVANMGCADAPNKDGAKVLVLPQSDHFQVGISPNLPYFQSDDFVR